MRKFACLLVVLVLVASSTALADEILFRDIPWGSNIDDVENHIGSIGYHTSEDESYLPYWSKYDGDPFGLALGSAHYPVGWLSYYMLWDDSFLIAGYPLSTMSVWMTYGLDGDNVLRNREDSRLYMAAYTFSVLDIETTYDDLVIKLTTLYGHGEETIENGGGYYADSEKVGEYTTIERTIVWIGDENTSVRLASCTSDRGIEEDWTDNYLVLMYGKTDSDAHLDSVSAAVKNELLNQEEINRTDNTDGL